MQKPSDYRFKFYHDSGHGWLAVKRALLLQHPETALAISGYSYQKGGSVYLEEDEDTHVFLEALRKKGYRFTILAQNPVTRSKIRSYAAFKLSEQEVEGAFNKSS